MEVMTLMATDRVPFLLDLPHSIILGHPGVTGVILEYRTVSLTDGHSLLEKRIYDGIDNKLNYNAE